MPDTLAGRFADELSDISTPNQFITASTIYEIAVRLLGEYGCSHQQQLLDAARQAYRTHVRPIDLPGVPNFIEPIVDDRLEEALVRLLQAVFNKRCAVAPTDGGEDA